MALRWIRAKDRPGGYAGSDHEDEWLLMSGGLVIGQVFPVATGAEAPRWSWSLTGPYSPTEFGAPTRGDALGRHEAMAALLASWRRWQRWAEVRDA